MMRHFRLTTLVALFVVISAVAVAAAPYAYVSQQGTSSVFIVDTGTTPPSAAVGIPPIAVPSGRMPWGVALSPDGAMLFVTNFSFSGSVMAFNTSTGALIREVLVGMLAFGVAVNPTDGEVYVTVALGNGPLGPGPKVVAIHPSTWANLGAPPVMASMPMPGPRGVAVNSAGTNFYVTNFANNKLHVFNGVANADGTHNLIKAVDLTDVPPGEIRGSSPVGVAVSPDGSTVYVANQVSNSVTLVNAADNTIKETVLVGNGPTGVAVSPDGLEVYVTNQWSDTVSVFDAAGSTIGSEIDVGDDPEDVDKNVQPFGISTDGLFVYVALFNGGKIKVIERTTRAKSNIPALFPVGFGKFVNPAMKIATVMSLSLSSESITLGSATPITATGTLQRKNNGAPVADASIMFTVGTSSGTAVTGANGTAQWSFSASALGIGSYTVQAVFSESKIGSNVYVGSEASSGFSVRYAFAWLRPTNGSTTGVNAGATVPVQWTITDANGAAISDLGVVEEPTSAPCASGSSIAAKSARIRASSAGGSDLRYNTDHFMYNWKTDKAWAGSCRQFIVSLNDGSSHSLTFQFR